MATPVVRTTYALDQETVERLERLARGWKLSRSAALRKLIREAPGPSVAAAPSEDPRLKALQQLQASMRRLTTKQVADWQRDVRLERQAGARKIRTRLKKMGR
ncbi:MAG TPA: CopG family transcriptional regulator [Terriglobales bacterium]|nr:CopG family transcriptional regulator [Terriglobales bacterium]